MERDWKIWNNNKDNNPSGTELIDPQDGSLKSGPVVGEIFNNYFSNVGENLFNAIPNLMPSEQIRLKSTMNQKVTRTVNSIFEFRPITLFELERRINKIETHKNSGIDNISSYLLKVSFKILLPHVHHIFNRSITSGIFPNVWKKAIITPLFKSGNNRDPQNY